MAKEENIILPVIAGVALLLLFSSSKKTPPPGGDTSPEDNLTPTQFILRYWNDAKLSQAQTKVPALVTITQGGLESGWGKHAPGFNYFGIKDSSSWSGATQRLLTWECGPTGNAAIDKITDEVVFILPPGDPAGVCGPEDMASLYNWNIYKNKYSQLGDFEMKKFFSTANEINISSPQRYSYRVRASFRKYDSARASFIDHGLFLANNSRYKNAFNYTNDPENFIKQIASAGYATDPGYANKLISSMKIVLSVLQAHHLA